MSRKLGLVLVFSSFVFAALFTGCPGDNPTTMGEQPVLGDVTVRVVTLENTPQPVANKTIALNAEDGALLDSKKTDGSGTVVFRGVEAGAWVSAEIDYPAIGKLLNTITAVVPNQTYTFLQPVAETSIATIEVNLPTYSGAQGYAVHIGECNGSTTGSSETVTLKAKCVEKSGKISIYATAYDINYKTIAQTTLTGQSFTLGGTTTINVPTWTNTTESLDMIFAHGPQDMTQPFVQFSAQRDGTLFSIEGSTSTPPVFDSVAHSYTQRFSYPRSLPLASATEGFWVNYQDYTTSATTLLRGFMAQSPVISGPLPFDLRNWEPTLANPSLYGDFSELGRPAINWNGPSAGESFDAAMTLIAWVGSMGETRAWIALSHPETGSLKFPELPSALADFAAPTGGQFTGPILYFMDSSETNGYDEAARANTLEAMIFNRLPTEKGSMRYVGMTSTDIAFRATAPGARKSLVTPFDLLKRK